MANSKSLPLKMVRRKSLRQAGFTLIEVIIVIVLLGVMMAGMAALFVQNIGNSHQPYLRQKALAVANAFMEEIQRKRWDENTPVGGGCVNTGSSCLTGPVAAGIGAEEASRSQYDDVDDYHNLSQNPPEDAAGTAMPGFNGFNVEVTVTQAAWNGIPANDVKAITVTVTSTSNESIRLTSYRLNF